MKVLVTGADGFIGSHLCDELSAQDHEVCELGLNVDGDGRIDLRKATAVIDFMVELSPDALIHLGGVSGPMVAHDDPAKVADVNCTGTINVLEGARMSGISRIVYASSISGFDGGTVESPIPLTVYGATKRFGEMVTEIYRRDFGISTISARIGSVYGQGRETVDVLDLMLNQAREARCVYYSPGAVVPLIAVQDLARSLVELGTLDDPPSACELITETLTEYSLAQLVANQLGLPLSAVKEGSPKKTNYPQLSKSFYSNFLLRGQVQTVHNVLKML